MFVGDRMSHPVIFVTPDTRVQDARQLMKQEGIRRLPVIENGKLVGIVTDYELLNASPSKATTLSVWEINYLLSKITVEEVMTREVVTISKDTPIEDAARIMADKGVSGLPVVEGDKVIGIITETDLFRVLLELLGARDIGVRATFLIANQSGEFAKFTSAFAKEKANIVAMGAIHGDDPTTVKVMCKVAGLDKKQVQEIIEASAIKLIDIREYTK
jgi:acetoin utilization protein AcuB